MYHHHGIIQKNLIYLKNHMHFTYLSVGNWLYSFLLNLYICYFFVLHYFSSEDLQYDAKWEFWGWHICFILDSRTSLPFDVKILEMFFTDLKSYPLVLVFWEIPPNKQVLDFVKAFSSSGDMITCFFLLSLLMQWVPLIDFWTVNLFPLLVYVFTVSW